MRARTKLAVTSVIGLLLMGLVPAITHAETSSEVVYPHPDQHTSFGVTEPKKPARPDEMPDEMTKRGRQKATAPEDPPRPAPTEEGGTTTPPSTPHPGSAPREPKPAPTAQPPHAKIAVATARVARGADRRLASDVRPGQALPGQGTIDDGSSPIVPILIAVAILAALSIGIAFYRERIRPRSR